MNGGMWCRGNSCGGATQIAGSNYGLRAAITAVMALAKGKQLHP